MHAGFQSSDAMTPASQTPRRVAIETQGCKLNQADSMALAREFTAAGFHVVDATAPFDAYVLNSCTVTHVADRKARQALRAARRRNPDATIVAAGCYAQRSPETLREIQDIDIVLGNENKRAIVSRVLGAVTDATPVSATGLDPIPNSTSDRTRAMVKIQEGCDQVCAFCIVPRVRGRERSVAPEAVVEDISRFESLGFKEVVLTGTQLGSYGFDLPANEDLKSLLARILDSTTVPRIRVSSLQPQDIDEGLLELWADPRLCPHFHLPLQSGSDSVLKRMRRRYDADAYEMAVDAVRRQVSGVAVTADVIVGFPGETDEDFRRTFDLCKRVKFADLHVFPYSPRPGTSAAHFDDRVAPEKQSERSRELLANAVDCASDFGRTFVGTSRPVLWESSRESGAQLIWTGLTDNYLRVTTISPAPLANTITDARLDRADDHGLISEAAIETAPMTGP
jgi:threonylcarbamoyladenosine tRNA methylthiotransferase MtaB